MSRLHIAVPPDAQIRMVLSGHGATVTIAPAGLPCDILEAVRSGPPAVHQMLRHDAGVSWPDTTGCQLANHTLARGDGLVVAEFASLADALAFRRRLGEVGPSPGCGS